LINNKPSISLNTPHHYIKTHPQTISTMARTSTTVSRERTTTLHRYPWPENLLNYWTIIMLATGGLLTGVFASFMSIQSRMGLGTPWLFPYAVTVGSLTLFFVILMIVLLAQKKLQPAWVLLGCFILIALFLAGLIETAVQLFGNVSCSLSLPLFSLPPPSL
jgi:cation transporter-like permease